MPFYISRYANRRKKTYKIEVVTPLFISGADITKSELRAASIKGVLRFWWRALNPLQSIDELKKNEGKIFGAALDSEQSKAEFSLFVEELNCKIENKMQSGKQVNVNARGRNFSIDIFTYLGFGIYEHNRGWKRTHIAPGSTFALHCIYSSKDVQQEVEKALSALIHYGGLGAKSRNGFGSLYSNDVPFINFINDYKDKLRVGYTAFSQKSKLFTFKTHSNWVDALSEIGIAYRKMRLAKDLDARHDYTNRQYIGLPIVQSRDRAVQNGRHSKLCFLHVSKVNNQFRGQILLLPYKYGGPLSNKNDQYDAMVNEVEKLLDKISKNENIQTIY